MSRLDRRFLVLDPGDISEFGACGLVGVSAIVDIDIL